MFAETTLKHDDFAGVTLYYKVNTPKDYDPAKEYPAVLAFPGGAQSYADGGRHDRAKSWGCKRQSEATS